MGVTGLGSWIEAHPLPAVALAIASGMGAYVLMHGGKLSALSGASRGLRGQVSNQELLGVASDVQPTDAQGFADITMLNNYFQRLQDQIDKERTARLEAEARAGQYQQYNN